MDSESQPLASESVWNDCPQNTIKDLARRCRTAKANRAVRRVTATLIVAAVIVGGVWRSIAFFRGVPEVRCAEIQRLLPKLVAGDLPESCAEALTSHLRDCPCCALHLRILQEESESRVFAPQPRSPEYTLEMLAVH